VIPLWMLVSACVAAPLVIWAAVISVRREKETITVAGIFWMTVAILCPVVNWLAILFSLCYFWHTYSKVVVFGPTEKQ
jgi:hypothetical protein